MKRLAGPATILALALAGYGFLLLHPGSVATAHSDLATFHLVRKQALFDSLRSGHGVPLWQENQLSGGPAFTDPTALYLMPLHVLFWMLPAARAMAPTIWLLLLTAGLATWVLAGELGLTFWPRLLAASAMLFSPKLLLAAYAGWLAYLPTMALLPLFFAAILRLTKEPTARHAAWAAAAGALCLVSGMTQLVYFALFFIAALVLAGRKASARVFAWLGVAAALAFGLAAHQLVPLLAERKLFLRQELSYAQFLAGHGQARSLLTLLWPDALGAQAGNVGLELWEDSAHFGFAALLLSLVALWRRRKPALLFGAFLLVTLLFGLDSPVLRAAHAWLPGLSLFRVPSRVLFLGAMFCACLAGLGLEGLPRWAGPVAVLLVAGQGVFEARRLFSRSQPEALDPHPDYAQLIAGDDHRVASAGRAALNAGWAASLHVQIISGYEPLSLRHYQRYFELLRHNGIAPVAPSVWTDLDAVARWDLLDELGVRWVVAEASAKAPPRLQLAQTFPRQPELFFYRGLFHQDLAVYRNPGEQPRARLIGEVVQAAGEDAAVRALQHLDASRTAVVEGAFKGAGTPLLPEEKALLDRFRPGQLAISTHAVAPRLLLVSEVWHPGWRATIDGQAAPVLKADVALMGVAVPAGSHEVGLRFQPLYLWPSVLLSALSVLGCLWLAKSHRDC
jgi:Bacterial membrane protein YfhO